MRTLEKGSCEITQTRKWPQKRFSIRGATSDYSHLGIDFVSPQKPAETLANRFFHSFLFKGAGVDLSFCCSSSLVDGIDGDQTVLPLFVVRPTAPGPVLRITNGPNPRTLERRRVRHPPAPHVGSGRHDRSGILRPLARCNSKEHGIYAPPALDLTADPSLRSG